MAKFAVIMPAAGKSERFQHQHYKKVFAPLDNRAVWLHSAEKFLNRDDVIQLILPISAEDREFFEMKFSSNVALMGIQVIEGGAARWETVQKALDLVKPEADFVCVHDAARPCLAEAWINSVFAAAEKHDAAILANPLQGTIKRVGKSQAIRETVPREGLWEAQTPQVFRRELLQKAYQQRGDLDATDDAQLVEHAGHAVYVVQGSPLNMKIATQEDLRLATQILKVLPKPRPNLPTHPFADDDHWR